MCARSRSSSRDRPAPIQMFDVTLTVRGREFTFPLCGQLRHLGPDVQITYYWINQQLLRQNPRDQSRNLYRRIVDYWEQALYSVDPSGAHSPSEELILARAFRVLSGKKRMHQVFRDATLRPLPPRGSIYREIAIASRRAELTDDLQQRIEDVVNERDSNAVRREFALIFGWVPQSAAELAVLNQSYDRWVARAAELYRSHPETGIDQFVDEFCKQESKLRRSSRTSAIARKFLDFIMFESKVSFYGCYAVLWQGLILWLKENRNLDVVSEQFLRIWHNQNPSWRRAIVDGVERFETDAFFGHILALHPLSGILMESPATCVLAGRFFQHAGADPVIRRDIAPRPEYWELVQAILTSGHAYRLNDRRHEITPSLNSPTLESASPFSREQDPTERSEIQDSLARIARLLEFTCHHCNAPLQNFRCSDPERSTWYRLTGQCVRCMLDSTKEFDSSVLSGEFSPEDPD